MGLTGDRASPALDIRHLSKTFGDHTVLQAEGLVLLPGEIHALVGQNGCGKSTLIKCLSGFHSPDAGSEVLVNGVPLPSGYSGADAAGLGFSFIHQDLGLVPSLSVMENMFLGHTMPTTRSGRIRWREVHRRCGEVLASFGHADIDPAKPVGEIPRAMQTVVAMGRALHDGKAKVLVLDEPTASLPRAEIEQLFSSIREAARRGTATLYVSHHLDEIFEIADRVTVLREGAVVGTYLTSDLDEQQLVDLIVGRKVGDLYPNSNPKPRNKVALQARGLSGNRIHDLDLDLHEGEIVGVTGLLGCGRSELGRLLFGVQESTSGEVTLDGAAVSFRSPKQAVAAGLGYVPENRAAHGLHPAMTLTENITLASVDQYFRRGALRTSMERKVSQRLLDKFLVRPPRPSARISSLSGGNQQKAVLAKWLHLDPKVVILDEPVQGIDIGAKAEIYQLVADAAQNGTAVLMLGSEIEDLAQVCDRVVVLVRGRRVAELSGSDLTADRITQFMYSAAAPMSSHRAASDHSENTTRERV